MKKIIALAGFVFLISCTSASIPTQQETKFEKIFSFPGESKKNIYEKSLQWIGRFQGGEIILYQNPDQGTIICDIEKEFSARMNSNSGVYTIYSEIEVKEGKTRIALSFPPVLPKEEIEKNREEIFKDYESYMSTKKAADW